MTQRHGAQILDEPVYRSMRHWMLTLVQAFTARRGEEMRPRIQQIVDAILDRVLHRRVHGEARRLAAAIMGPKRVERALLA